MVFVPLIWFPIPFSRLLMSLYNSVVQVPLSPSTTVSTVWFSCACECRGYLWGGLHVGVFTLSGGIRGGLGVWHGSTVGGTFGGAWGSAFLCSGVSCIVAWVLLGVGVGAPVAAKMLAYCWIASMFWAPKQAKVAASVGLDRALARRLDASL